MGIWETLALAALVGFSASVGVAALAGAASAAVRRLGMRRQIPSRTEMESAWHLDSSDAVERLRRCLFRCRRLSFVPDTAGVAGDISSLAMRLIDLHESFPKLVSERFAPGSLTYDRFAQPAEEALAEATDLVFDAMECAYPIDADRYAYLGRKGQTDQGYAPDEEREFQDMRQMLGEARRKLDMAAPLVDSIEDLRHALDTGHTGSGETEGIRLLSEELERLSADITQYD